MLFSRLAILSFPKSIDHQVLKFPLEINDVVVQLILEKEKEDFIWLVITTIIKADGKLSLNASNCIEMDKEILDSCHLVIESIANLIAVSQNCERHISSPTPVCAILPENQEEKDFLESSDGIQSHSHVAFIFKYTFSFSDIDPNLLGDRGDGVALLAEAISHKHITGRFHELIRFFERAFKRSSNALHKPLLQFLSSSTLNFNKKEIYPWFLKLRNPLTHADDIENFLLEKDVIPSIDRMELAAYDVLLNKVNWRDASPDRRYIWKPTHGSHGGTDLFLTTGKSAQLGFQHFDHLGVYKFNLAGGLTYTPEGWYTKFSIEKDYENNLVINSS
jgi:hypothetical protein